MVFCLQEVIILHGKTFQDHLYIRIQSQQTFINSISMLPFQNQLRCLPNILISQQYPLKIQIWNYDAMRIVKSWKFQKQEVGKLKVKHLVNQLNWTLFLKKQCLLNESNKENNINKMNKLKSESHLKIRPKLKTYNDKQVDNKRKRQEITEILQNKSKRDKKSVKKVLKNTIQYLIKQQNQISHHKDLQINIKQKLKSGKCTPAMANVFSPQNSSAIFLDYGLNELNSEIKNNEKFKTIIRNQSKKKENRIR